MLKNIIKLSGLFCAIFVALFILFFKITVFAAPPVVPTYIYSCFCFDPNPTPGNTNFRSSRDHGTTNPDPVAFCTSYCGARGDTGKKWEVIGYQKDGEDVVIMQEKYKQLYLQQSPEEPETTPKPDQKTEATKEYLCTCQDEKKSQYSIANPDDCSFKCLGAGYEITEQVGAETVCHCPNGKDFSKAEGTTCEVVCKDETAAGTQQTGTGQTTTGCFCKNKDNDSSITDTAACTDFCGSNNRGGVESYVPPTQGPGQQISGTRIDNPIGVDSPAQLIQKIINYVLGIVGAVAVLIIIYSGFVYMTSRGNEKQIESAKNSLTYAIIGLVVIFASIIIVNAVISAIGG